ncbi:MAG: outer membrane protein transport protein [Labilithrix sp.]|nr:outer membrane protein transport protein [Labilithrix sp.]MCW5813668.1 outer membrane protein transport protein [Labilithrix sp.]
MRTSERSARGGRERPANTKRHVAFVVALVILTFTRTARAGGIDEMPDHGAQAMGRGAAFTAKADDASALHYNVAGLARQRGTKLQISANTHFNTLTFQRAGNYPDDPNDPLTPWGGRPYPLVEDKNKAFTLPMILATTDFGYFERFTLGVGLITPAATGRTFQLGINGTPSGSRYDAAAGYRGESVIAFPTLGGAFRVTEQLDIGIAAHLIVANASMGSIAYADVGDGSCKNPEYRPCDAEGRFTGKGGGAGFSVGAMYRPSESFQLGAQLRGPLKVDIEGTTVAKVGLLAKEFGEPGATTANVQFPPVLRVGGRYIAMEKKRELWDAELDVVYEMWGTLDEGIVKTVSPVDGKEATIKSGQTFKNTFSLRGGGAYNHAFDEKGETVFIARAGAFYESPGTEPKDTRLNFNTLPKVAATFGAGIKHGAVSVNVAYGAVFSISRTVTDGDARPSNGAMSGAPTDGKGNLLPAYNNGVYSAFSHVLSVGIEVDFEALFRDRKVEYGDSTYEDVVQEDEDDQTEESSAKKKTIGVGVGVGVGAPEAAAKRPESSRAVSGDPAAMQEEPPGTWWQPRVPDSELQDYRSNEEAAPPPPVKRRSKKAKRRGGEATS